MDFAAYMEKNSAPASTEIWDIHVEAGIKENTVEYKPNHHVTIRANSIDYALSLINRGRELISKYSPHSL